MLQRRPAAAAAAAAVCALLCSSQWRPQVQQQQHATRPLQLAACGEAAAQPGLSALCRAARAAQGAVHGGRRGAAFSARRAFAACRARAQVPCGGGATPLSARSERGAAPLPARPALVSRLVAARLLLHPPYLHSSASRPSAVGRDAPLRASAAPSARRLARACRTATQLASSHASSRTSPAPATARPRGASAAAARPSLSGTRGSVGAAERTSSD